MDLITKIGTILGYVSTAIALYVVLKTSVLKKTDKHIKAVAGKEESDKVHTELDNRLDRLESQFSGFIEKDEEFKTMMGEYIESQNNVNKRVLANIIETTYYENRECRTLDTNQLKRVTEAYALYHSEQIHGNSYISQLYEEMMTWERV